MRRIPDETEWIKRLSFAALTGAERVQFSCEVTPHENSTQFRLSSLDASGNPIGDDRDYDLLKAVVVPLERLSAGVKPPFTIELHMKTQSLVWV